MVNKLFYFMFYGIITWCVVGFLYFMPFMIWSMHNGVSLKEIDPVGFYVMVFISGPIIWLLISLAWLLKLVVFSGVFEWMLL